MSGESRLLQAEAEVRTLSAVLDPCPLSLWWPLQNPGHGETQLNSLRTL